MESTPGGWCRRAVSIALLAAIAMASACGSDASDEDVDRSEPPGSTIGPSEGLERAASDPGEPVGELVAGFSEAGFDLMRAQPADENLVFSPLSIGHALLMARGAADETTGEAIDVALGLPEGMAAHGAWNTLDLALAADSGTQTALDGTESPIVTLADRLWPSTTATPDQGWIDLMATHHGAGVESFDPSDPEVSRERINGWVSDQTNELIPELLPPGFIGPDTVLVLTDTVYFKAQWRSIFGKYGSEIGPFTRLDGTEVDVPFLVDLEQPGPRGSGDGFVGAEIPYLGDGFSILLIVPDEGRFEEIRERLSVDLLAEIDAAFTTGPYELRMPEWETTTAFDFLDWLKGLGIAPGNYPGIAPDAFLAGAVHGADITVDELGTEAAAATALGFVESGSPQPEIVVAADRPFFYLVRHVGTGAILFAGQVTDPTS
ncbi:MAG: serpin family protein [Actinomycetia bacterium]|nr:serpin family protein [Actinomycetes bacterium]